MSIRQSPPSASSLNLVASALQFLSASLVLLTIPLIASRLLPWYEGAASVWIITVAVTMGLVLAGYAVALTIRRIPSLKAQVLAFLSIVLLSATSLPLLPSESWQAEGLLDPTGWLVLTLLCSVGLPVVALGSTGPLLHHWGRSSELEYGSSLRWGGPTLAALGVVLAYPVAIEPFVSLPQQSNAWALLFLICGACIGLYGWRLASARSRVTVAESSPPGPERVSHSNPAVALAPASRSCRMIASAMLLGAIPSALMLSVMQDLMTQVAAISWLGLLPLVVYGVTLLLPLVDRRWRQPSVAASGFVLAAALLAGGSRTTQLPMQLAVDLGLLFSVGLLCHSRLAERSETAGMRLSAAAAGGAFVAFVAPHVFTSYHEFLLTIVAASALVAGQIWTDLNGTRRGWRLVSLAAGVTLFAALWGLGREGISEQRDRLAERRTFYGVLRVDARLVDLAVSGHRALLHGRYQLGMQYLGEDQRRRPVSSAGPKTGVGRVLNYRVSEAPRNIGVVGLGTGALAAYCDPQDAIRFYEGNPALAEVAREYFGYLANAEVRVEVVVGNPRAALEREIDKGMPSLDLLVVDSLAQSSMPAHLLTRDAMATYLGRLSPRGMLAIQLSNRHIDLEPVVADLANEFGLEGAVVVARPDRFGETMSIWALLCRDESALKSESLAGARSLRDQQRIAWRDRYSNLFACFKPFRAEGLFPAVEADSRLTRAVAAMQEQRWDVAEECYRQLVAADPTQIDYYIRLGDICLYRGDADRSVEWYTAALKINQESAAAHNSLGSVLARKDPTTARQHFLTAIQCDATLPGPHVNLGNLLFRHGRIQDAVKEYQTALQLRPGDKAAIENLRQATAMLKTPVRKENAAASVPAL